jgi:hypothetical protein
VFTRSKGIAHAKAEQTARLITLKKGVELRAEHGEIILLGETVTTLPTAFCPVSRYQNALLRSHRALLLISRDPVAAGFVLR